MSDRALPEPPLSGNQIALETEDIALVADRLAGVPTAVGLPGAT